MGPADCPILHLSSQCYTASEGERYIPTPTIEISPALPFAKKSEYLTVDNAAQMYSSNLARRSSSLPRNLGSAPFQANVAAGSRRSLSIRLNVSFASETQVAYTIISLLDSMDDIIHPSPISRCQTDHPLRLGIREIERNILNLPSAKPWDEGNGSSH